MTGTAISEKLSVLLEEEMGDLGGFVLRKQCNLLGIVPKNMKASDLPLLAERLAHALSGFVTQDKAQKINKMVLKLANVDDVISRESSPDRRAIMTLSIGESYINTGDWSLAEKHFSKMLKDGEDQKDRRKQADALRRLAFIAEEKGFFEDAMQLYEDSLKVSEVLQDSRGIASAYAGIGHIQWKMGNYATASVILQKGEDFARSADSKVLRGRLLLDMGNVAGDQGNGGRARELYKKALSFLEQGSPEEALLDMARAYNNLGDTYLRSMDYESALEYFTKSMECAKNYGNEDMRGWALFNMAETLAKLGRVEEGYEQARKSKDILSRMSDQLGMANIENCFGLLYSADGKLEEALESHKRALAEYRRLSTPLEQGLALKAMGEIYMSQGKNREAERSLLEAKNIFNNHQIRDEALRVELLLKEASFPQS